MKSPTFLPSTMQNHTFLHPGHSIHSSLPTQPSHVHLPFEAGSSSNACESRTAGSSSSSDQGCSKQWFLFQKQVSQNWEVGLLLGIRFAMIPSIIFLGSVRAELWGTSIMKLKSGSESLGNIHKAALSPEFGKNLTLT